MLVLNIRVNSKIKKKYISSCIKNISQHTCLQIILQLAYFSTLKNFVEVLPKSNALFPPYLFCHLIVSSFPRSLTTACSVCVVIATKFKKHGRTDTAQEAFSLTNATKSAKMHGRIGNPSCEYISTRPILNRNKNIPICMCYDRSFRVSILLATSCYHGGPSQSIRHQSKVATSRNMLINMLLHSLQPPKCSLKTMHKQRSLIFSQAVSIFWFCFALRYSA